MLFIGGYPGVADPHGGSRNSARARHSKKTVSRMDFENGRPEATRWGLRHSAAVLKNLPFREDPPWAAAAPLPGHPALVRSYRGFPPVTPSWAPGQASASVRPKRMPPIRATAFIFMSFGDVQSVFLSPLGASQRASAPRPSARRGPLPPMPPCHVLGVGSQVSAKLVELIVKLEVEVMRL